MTEYCYAENREKIIKLGKISIGPPWDIMFGSCSQLTTHQSVANAICSFCFRIPCTEESLTKIHHFVANCLKARLYTGYLRDLSEISGGGGRGVETEEGSQLFETQKREGSWKLGRSKGEGHANICPWSCRGSPTEEKASSLFVKSNKKQGQRNIMDINCEVLLQEFNKHLFFIYKML